MRLLPFVALASLGACGFKGTSEPLVDGPVIADAAIDATSTIDGPAAQGPMLVQQKTQSAATGAALTVTLTTAPASGNTLVFIGAANSGTLTAVAGGGVAVWTRAAMSASNANIEVWFGVTDGSSASIAVSRATNVLAIWGSVTEWSGLATSNALDKAATMAGSSGTATAGTINTTNARDLLLFAIADENAGTFGTPTQGPWSAFATVSVAGIRQTAWHRVVSATGPYAPQVTSSGNDWDAALVALRIAP